MRKKQRLRLAVGGRCPVARSIRGVLESLCLTAQDGPYVGPSAYEENALHEIAHFLTLGGVAAYSSIERDVRLLPPRLQDVDELLALAVECRALEAIQLRQVPQGMLVRRSWRSSNGTIAQTTWLRTFWKLKRSPYVIALADELLRAVDELVLAERARSRTEGETTR